MLNFTCINLHCISKVHKDSPIRVYQRAQLFSGNGSLAYVEIKIKTRYFKEMQIAHAHTDKWLRFLRGQSAHLYSLLLQLHLLSILSLSDLPDVNHDGGVAADYLRVLLTRHL